MTASDNRGNAKKAKNDWLASVPPAWVAVVMLLSLRGLVRSWPVLSHADLPSGILTFIYVSMAASTMTLLWGLFVLGLAVGRSPSFPRAFAAWQIAILIILVAREIYVLATPAFVFNLTSHIWPIVEAVIGVFCLVIILRDKSSVAVQAGAVGLAALPATRPPAGVLASVLAALLGVIVGAAVGCGAGLLIGAGIAEATDISCFEGGCGYFAVFIGLLGLLVGAIAGGILAVWLVRRPRPAAT